MCTGAATSLPAVAEFRGDKRLSNVVLRDVRSGATRDVDVVAAFVFIGLEPNTGFLADTVTLDERGFIVTDAVLQTNLPGVFAAGDARAGSTKQLVSAAGEGATTALMIGHCLEQTKVVRPRREEVED